MDIIGVSVNMVYAVVGIFIGLVSMKIGYNVLDQLTAYNTSEELLKGNVSVGTAIAGMFIGIGLCAGLIVGLALN